MIPAIIECVPNFSEGRDIAAVDAIAAAIAATPGVALLARESDRDHNRSVITFAGAPDVVAEAALKGIAEAVKRIDVSRHTGVHPWIGAADVVPFVPIQGVSLEHCAALALETAEEVWRTLRVPVYLYEAAARIPERARLENIRRGGLPYLREHLDQRMPDVGDVLHPTAGATVIGARKLLIALNFNLTTPDVEVARKIAKHVRESSGGLPAVKALGLPIASRGLAQISVNLTDYEITGLFQLYEAIRLGASRYGVGIATTEIIGLVPRKALEMAAVAFLNIENFTPGRVLERRIEEELGQEGISNLPVDTSKLKFSPR